MSVPEMHTKNSVTCLAFVVYFLRSSTLYSQIRTRNVEVSIRLVCPWCFCAKSPPNNNPSAFSEAIGKILRKICYICSSPLLKASERDAAVSLWHLSVQEQPYKGAVPEAEYPSMRGLVLLPIHYYFAVFHCKRFCTLGL